MNNNKEKIAVVLLQLGGPDKLEAVEPFLYNLFCDPDIIDIPGAFLFRKKLARIISTRRAPKYRNYINVSAVGLQFSNKQNFRQTVYWKC